MIRPKDDKKCSSAVGRAGGQQTLKLGKKPGKKTCYREKIILHEFIHAIGYAHEQSRFDRDSYINIEWENVKKGRNNTNFRKTNENWLTFNTTYDGKSVMQYPATLSSKNGKNTMTSLVCSL